MTNISHGPAVMPGRLASLRGLEWNAMLASLSIVVMWLAVLFDALFGPNIVTTTPTTTTSVPSAVAVALFAFLGTSVVAHYGFRGEKSTRY